MEGDTSRHFSLNLINSITEPPKDPKIEYKAEVNVVAKQFKELLKDVQLMANNIYITASEKGLAAKGEGDVGTVDILLPKDQLFSLNAKTEEKALREQLIPVWNEQGKEKLELVNSLIEKLPEDEQKAAKERFEKMDIADLKLVNSFGTGEPPEPAPGVTARGAGGNQNTRMTKEEKENKEIMDKLENMGYFK